MVYTGSALLEALSRRECDRIRTLTPPVVRVCGPLTGDSKGEYHQNVQKFLAAEKELRQKGYSVWSFKDAEEDIYGKGFDHDDIVTCFHEPIIRSGLISIGFFLPGWEQSKGATRERELMKEVGIEVRDL